ncbi:DUF3309 family protein [Aquibium oceanicum]|uniref:DUF3309 domain-containing protein n=1 Tax=Aquibium oceanicum TaxID=1670800 RepID=A0A1L3SKR8_9HYPH|nr:DUF3309 family protein [Aquibium oceanicum]APH69978.1 DUF3309 domain-containing protein [Aquibium oceanicum]
MSLTTLFIIVLILALVAVLPTWPWSRRWRWVPSIIMATILAVVIYLAQAGRF